MVLKGSDKWNESLKIYANYVSAAGKLERSMNADLADDRYGIGIIAAPTTSLGRNSQPPLKILSVAETDSGPYVPYTLETLHERSYPLYDHIYAYVDRVPGKPMDPKVLEFLRFVLSEEGQDAVMRDGKYVPLTAEVAKTQLKKLEQSAQ
jgi:phosphate transport system substrate-binding protein